MIYMKVIKKNQIIIFVMALMLITVGYVNFGKEKNNAQDIVATSSMMDSEQMAGIGDAQLVNSNGIEEDENMVLDSDEEKNRDIEKIEETQITSGSSLKNEEYFNLTRLERDKMYSQMLETYKNMLENTSISETQKSIAQSEITRIQGVKNSIMISENLIKNKGIKNVIIFVNENSISVIVDTEKIGDAEIAQIQNIIVRELNAEVEDIHISQK